MSTTDEIYEKYLQKAIVEINDLAHEVAQSAAAPACPSWAPAIRWQT